MQVWSQRKPRPLPVGESPAEKSVDSSAAEIWALRVVAGVHAGAERKLQDREMLMVGSSDDCDLIFTDTDVAAHHCIISREANRLSVRAVDGDVRVDDRLVHPGDPQAVEPFSVIHLGTAALALGPHWSDRWQTLTGRSDTAVSTDGTGKPDAATSKGMSRVAPLAVAAVLLLSSVAALALARHGSKPAPVAKVATVRDDEVRSVIASLGYKGLTVRTGADSHVVVGGYVERPEDLAALRAGLDRKGLNAVVDAKSGARIASDVAESLRISNLHATTQWKGAGHVLATGHFGDGKDIEAFVRSRTMQEFNTNLDLTLDVQNLDPAQAAVKNVPDGKRIRRVVQGDDPYLVSRDGSLFYSGAKLPNGGTFVGIENGEVLVRDDADNIQRRAPESLVDDASSN